MSKLKCLLWTHSYRRYGNDAVCSQCGKIKILGEYNK